ncbi:hypothetical protein ACNKHO_14770 [Shigella flexneri]
MTKAMGSAVPPALRRRSKFTALTITITPPVPLPAHCIGNAVERIQLGKRVIIFAGGGEELGWEMACEFDAMGALSLNTTKPQTSLPYL